LRAFVQNFNYFFEIEFLSGPHTQNLFFYRY